MSKSTSPEVDSNSIAATLEVGDPTRNVTFCGFTEGAGQGVELRLSQVERA